MKKRILSLLLAGCMCLGLAACGQSGDDNSNAGMRTTLLLLIPSMRAAKKRSPQAK